MYYLVKYKNKRPFALYGARDLVSAYIVASNFLFIGMQISELIKRMNESKKNIVNFQSGGKTYGFWFSKVRSDCPKNLV